MDERVKIECAEHLAKLPPYLFSAINILKQQAYEKKLDVIDLGMGNPDLPTPKHIVERLCETVREHPKTHRYPQAKGMPKLRKAICEWMKKRFGVELNHENEVLVLIGSKEGVAHTMMTYLNPGDIAIITNPCYPVYFNSVILAKGEIYELPLLEKNNYLPDFTKIPNHILKRAKILALNYPNNPTTAVVEDLYFFKEAVKFAKKYNLILCNDNAYCEITFDGYVAPSLLQVEDAKDISIEFYSFSKTYNMAGWRIGFMVGNSDIIRYVEKFKSFIDYGVFTAIQLAAVLALSSEQSCVKEIVETYRRRRDKFVDGLNRLGWAVKKPKATFYLWAPLPEPYRHLGSLQFAELLLEKTGIVVAPGVGFGSYGEGYVRMALVTHDNRFHDALLRLKKFLKKEI
jgi:aspartate/methionine/tyrosine aminotransferase